MSHLRRGLAVERADVVPALGFRVQVLDAVTNTPDPIPTERFDVSEPGTAEAGIGDDDRNAVGRHHLMESVKEATMGVGVVITAQGMDFFVEREGAPADGQGGFEDEQFTAELAVAPIDDDDGTLGVSEEHRAECGIDSPALTVQMGITEEAVDGFDVMFDEGISGTCATEVGQSKLSAAEQRFDDSQECEVPGAVTDDGIAFEPGIQQASGVHAALSEVDGGVATTIRSDGSVHVDPVILCFQMTNRQNSWGYLSKALQPTRISAGCFPWRSVRAAELGR